MSRVISGECVGNAFPLFEIAQDAALFNHAWDKLLPSEIPMRCLSKSLTGNHQMEALEMGVRREECKHAGCCSGLMGLEVHSCSQNCINGETCLSHRTYPEGSPRQPLKRSTIKRIQHHIVKYKRLNWTQRVSKDQQPSQKSPHRKPMERAQFLECSIRRMNEELSGSLLGAMEK